MYVKSRFTYDFVYGIIISRGDFMDAKQIGNIISKLRKANGYTQAALAKKLNVSDKTVSKWESGLGYPEITQFPILASLFGVSIDYLMTGDRVGISVAGNMIVDAVKCIEEYPKIGMLAEVGEISYAVGGCASNTSIDLSRIDRSLPVSAIGCVGDDENGRFLTSVIQKNGVNTAMVRVTDKAPTAFSDVISQKNGERTFFSYRGANDHFMPEDINISLLKCRILHIGYILLLKEFDKTDTEYGTAMGRLLCQVQKNGIKTSVDVVSSSNIEDYPEKIIPALKYSDYVIINEIECCNIWGITPYKQSGELDVVAIRTAMEKTMAAGVREKVIVHCKSAGFCLSADGSFTKVGSLIIDKSLIKGSVGAGDAFCAGALYGIYNEYSDREMLEFATAAAVCNLFEVNSVDGMRNKDEIKKIMNKYGRVEI